jgi:hypothetical protein
MCGSLISIFEVYRAQIGEGRANTATDRFGWKFTRNEQLRCLVAGP